MSTKKKKRKRKRKPLLFPQVLCLGSQTFSVQHSSNLFGKQASPLQRGCPSASAVRLRSGGAAGVALVPLGRGADLRPALLLCQRVRLSDLSLRFFFFSLSSRLALSLVCVCVCSLSRKGHVSSLSHHSCPCRSIFNHLVRHRELCVGRNALHLKLIVSQVTNPEHRSLFGLLFFVIFLFLLLFLLLLLFILLCSLF